ncbi:MAG: hypothetical protein WC390_12425 [Sulfurimonas sp.]
MREELKRRVEKRLSNQPIGEFIIVGQEFCPNCAAIKELYKEEIESGEIKYYDIESEEGKIFEDLLGIEEIPYIVFHELSKDDYRKCELVEVGDNYELRW